MSDSPSPVAAFRNRSATWSIFVAFVVATLARGTGEFRSDALYYWWGAQDIVGSLPAAPADYWPLRGVLTAFVYTPAALVSAAGGERLAGFAVLLQNAVVLAGLAAFLLPRLVVGERPVTPRARWLGAGLIWLVTAGFAPYPLVDLYPAVGCLVIVVLLRSHRWWPLLLAGLIGGVAVNLRPAYILTVALLLVLALVRHRWPGLLVSVGVVAGLVPQIAFNAIVLGVSGAAVFPPESGELTATQTHLASYVIRYDTLFGETPQPLFYCSPDMATRLDAPLPTTIGGLASSFLSNMPTSVTFSLEKVGAALHWPLSTPYTVPMPGLDALFALAVTAITVVGCAVLLHAATRRRGALGRSCTQARYDLAGFGVVAGSTLLTLVSSATESRFALPLVLVGVVGCVTLANAEVCRPWQRAPWWCAGTAAVVLTVLALGLAGLAHPAPPDSFGQATCAAS